jgi:hypothetical protein
VQRLTEQGRRKIDELARRHGVSPDAVLTLLQALVAGDGKMAQFSHPELGGLGQWLQGGLTMVGDLFDHALQAKVNGLCVELAGLLSQQAFLTPSRDPGAWWPAELGVPDAAGAQGAVRYAHFAAARRLAVEVNGRVTVYDTLGLPINGVGQQDGVLTLTGPDGTRSLADLPVVSPAGGGQNPPGPAPR